MRYKYIIIMLILTVTIGIVNATDSGVFHPGFNVWGFDINMMGKSLHNGTINGTQFITSNTSLVTNFNSDMIDGVHINQINSNLTNHTSNTSNPHNFTESDPVAIANISTNWNLFTSVFNATYAGYQALITALQGTDTLQNASITALQGNDTVINNTFASYLPLAGGTMQGNITIMNDTGEPRGLYIGDVDLSKISGTKQVGWLVLVSHNDSIKGTNSATRIIINDMPSATTGRTNTGFQLYENWVNTWSISSYQSAGNATVNSTRGTMTFYNAILNREGWGMNAQTNNFEHNGNVTFKTPVAGCCNILLNPNVNLTLSQLSGTGNAVPKLDSTGKLYRNTSAGAGLPITSPDGSNWCIVVSNLGVLSATSGSCT